MSKPYPPIGYNDYLKVDSLLNLQSKRSDSLGQPAHDEMLFIVIHQTYELWFKQILTELDSVLLIFGSRVIDEEEMGTAVGRLERIVEIWKLLVAQVTVLETMTPLDFLDFREFLYPASGFQSVQNRQIENKLGLLRETRLQYNSMPYTSFVPEADKAKMLAAEQERSLFTLIDDWLARTPFLQTDSFDFWKEYQASVLKLFADDREVIRAHSILSPEEKERNLKQIAANEETFASLFDPAKYETMRSEGRLRLSYPAMHAVLLIQLYRDQPVLQLPFQLITALQDIDELMTTWRYRHSLMAHRMLGRKIGTGGSSGADYLKAATDKHRIFNDFFNLATFFIPRSKLPPLPEAMKKQLGFYYNTGAKA